jgi:TRAP-type C4-dicarboxylate transport system substrate-binding protein
LPPEFLAGLDSRFDLLCAPGLFDGDLKQVMSDANRVYHDETFNRAFLQLGSNKGLIGIALFPAGPMGLVTRTKVASPADIRGRKIRVLGSPMQENQIRKLGATPISMPLGELVPALQQGALDGAMSTLPVFAGFHVYDAAKYFLNTSQMVDPSSAFVSKVWFEKLPPDLQNAIREVGMKVSNEWVEPTIAYYESAQEAWIKGGGEIINLSASERAELMKSMATVGPELASRQSEYKALYDLLIAAVERHKKAK